MMSGAFSAALTAFVVINFADALGRHEWMAWVVPVLLMIAFSTRKIRQLREADEASRG
jgi:hypothetical protein